MSGLRSKEGVRGRVFNEWGFSGTREWEPQKKEACGTDGEASSKARVENPSASTGGQTLKAGGKNHPPPPPKPPKTTCFVFGSEHEREKGEENWHKNQLERETGIELSTTRASQVPVASTKPQKKFGKGDAQNRIRTRKAQQKKRVAQKSKTERKKGRKENNFKKKRLQGSIEPGERP